MNNPALWWQYSASAQFWVFNQGNFIKILRCCHKEGSSNYLLSYCIQCQERGWLALRLLKCSPFMIRGLGSIIKGLCFGNGVSADISINCQKTYSSKPTIRRSWREAEQTTFPLYFKIYAFWKVSVGDGFHKFQYCHGFLNNCFL